jgi:hypothetical protein
MKHRSFPRHCERSEAIWKEKEIGAHRVATEYLNWIEFQKQGLPLNDR